MKASAKMICYKMPVLIKKKNVYKKIYKKNRN